MSLDTQEHIRSVYSILDFLGDVGGLNSILLSIGQFFMTAISFIFGSALEKMMKASIFENKNQKRPEEDSKDQASDTKTKINEQTTAIKRMLNFCCCTKRRKSHALAMKKIQKELDVVTYIRR